MGKSSKTSNKNATTASRKERRKRRAGKPNKRSKVAKIDEGKLYSLLERLAIHRPISQEFEWDASHYAKKTKNQGVDRTGLEKSVPVMERVLEVTAGNVYPRLPGLRRVIQQLDVKHAIINSPHGKGDEVVCTQAADKWKLVLRHGLKLKCQLKGDTVAHEGIHRVLDAIVVTEFQPTGNKRRRACLLKEMSSMMNNTTTTTKKEKKKKKPIRPWISLSRGPT